MPSLSEITRQHTQVLVIDASSMVVQVSLLIAGEASRWSAIEGEAGVALFRGLQSIAASPEDVDAFIFCNGPGSILGIRSTAMAIRTWLALRSRPVYHYSSLSLVAHALKQPELSIIADARRETWHRFRLGQGLDRVALSELAGPLCMPADFRYWSALPDGVGTTPYRIEKLLPQVIGENLFSATNDPDAFLHQEPSYKLWEPQIHRAP